MRMQRKSCCKLLFITEKSFGSTISNYRIRRCLVPPKRSTFYQIHEGGLDNSDFYFLKFKKIFQNFLKFYNFFLSKVQVECCFIITASYLNKKKQKNRGFSSKLVLRHIFFQKNFCWKFFQRPRFFQIHRGGTRQGETGQHRIR